MKSIPDFQYLQSLLDYDPISGLLTWKTRECKRFNARFAGKIAGNKNRKGYLIVSITQDGKPDGWAAHQLAWAIHHSKWPEGPMDHANRVRDDNALSNLRVVTARENQKNRVCPAGESGVKGIYKEHNRWVPQTLVNGHRTRFGRFDTVEEAQVALDQGLEEIARSNIQLPYKNAGTKSKDDIDHAQLLRTIRYDPDTGLVYRLGAKKEKCLNEAWKSPDKQAQTIRVLGKVCQIHRLIWFYVHGKWPAGVIDHCDGNFYNNKLSNLRDVTLSINGLNKLPPSDATRGVRQIKHNRKMWVAQFQVDGCMYRLGTFHTEVDAQNAWQDAMNELCPGVIMRNNFPATISTTITQTT